MCILLEQLHNSRIISEFNHMNSPDCIVKPNALPYLVHDLKSAFIKRLLRCPDHEEKNVLLFFNNTLHELGHICIRPLVMLINNAS